MKISLIQIQTFYWVARLKSFHAASRHQHLTQPTISARIHELETTIGYRLFERHAQGVELTPKGVAFLEKATKLLKVADGMLAEDTAPFRSMLRLGSNESAALSGLAAFLHELNERYPTLQVELSIDVGSILRERLSAGGVDFAISTDPSAHPHIRNIWLGAQSMSWVAAKGKVQYEAPLSPTEIAAMPILTVPAPSALHAITTNWFVGERVSPPRMNFCNSLSVMLQLVVSDIAVAILPTALAQRELNEGNVELLQTAQPVPPLHMYASFPIIGDIRVFEDIAELARKALTDSNLISP